MKKKYLIISISILLVLTTCLYVFISDNNEKVVISSEENNKNILNTNALTMMYETGYQSGEYQVSSDTSWPQNGYIFNETLSRCENGGTLTWNSETNKVVMQTNSSDRCYVYFDKEQDIIYFADYIIDNVYTGTDGDNGLYYHDGLGSYINADQEAGDNSYRYAGANPNNYVCFGSDNEICPADNLYRIIGVFDGQAKLIKADYATSALLGTDGEYYGDVEYNNETYSVYYWNSGRNTWSQSNLNTVNLNQNYLNNIGSTWSSKIATHSWKVGGLSWDNTNTAKLCYNSEVGSSSSSTIYSAKIGLMYVSDYGYAAIPAAWNLSVEYVDGTNDYSIKTNTENNWLLTRFIEWTISRQFGFLDSAYRVIDSGYAESTLVTGMNGVRPSFYLQPWIILSGGDGTESNPYRISAPENLISFTIDGTTYYAEEGMTWGDLVNSSYNTLDIICSSYCSYTNLGNSAYNVIRDNDVNVVSSDIILENDYTIWSSHNGGGAN